MLSAIGTSGTVGSNYSELPTDSDALGVGASTKVVQSTLDAVSIPDTMQLPWEVSLTEYDDIYIGRDDIDNGDGTYTNTIEGFTFTRGHDNIDMGLGYNYAYIAENGSNEGIESINVNLSYTPSEGGSNVTVTMSDEKFTINVG